jgi:acyl-CoA-binding protein
MATMEQKFNAANDFLSVHSSKLGEAQRLSLYGLVKQVKNGDCTVAAPPK